MTALPPLAVRWTIGDVSLYGFEALRLSVWGAWRLFGPAARYVICANSLPLETAQDRTGPLPAAVEWRDATDDLPAFLRDYFDEGMAEGVGWKLAPVRLFPDGYELSLDNDCILWEQPAAIRRWLSGEGPPRCVVAEDVRRMFGRFEDLCGPEPRNMGIRGLPPGFDLERVLRRLLAEQDGVLTSELDEQGLQVAAVSQLGEPLAVRLNEVPLCSPFYPLRPHLGTCGAHFVGLNAHHLPWDYCGRPATECVREHWQRHRAELYRRVGLSAPAAKARTDSADVLMSQHQ